MHAPEVSPQNYDDDISPIINDLMKRYPVFIAIVALASLCLSAVSAVEPEKESLNVLFIGNSYTARHHLSEVVKSMAEAGKPGLEFEISTVLYGGRRLVDHWRLGTQNFVGISTLTREQEQATIASLEKAIADNPKDSHAKRALGLHRKLLGELESQRKKWDVVVLQSYRDDLEGDASLYAEYAPKFAEIVRAQGGRVLPYETSPTTQNAEALTSAPDPAPTLEKSRSIAALAERLNAAVAPMSLVALRCQTKRPDFTLRFINDGHLNHTMAYLTACTIYAALFEKSPEGLPINSITDNRFLDKDRANSDKDADGKPIKRTFSKKDVSDLQKMAWDAYQEFQQMRRE